MRMFNSHIRNTQIIIKQHQKIKKHITAKLIFGQTIAIIIMYRWTENKSQIFFSLQCLLQSTAVDMTYPNIWKLH